MLSLAKGLCKKKFLLFISSKVFIAVASQEFATHPCAMSIETFSDQMSSQYLTNVLNGFNTSPSLHFKVRTCNVVFLELFIGDQNGTVRFRKKCRLSHGGRCSLKKVLMYM